MKTRLLQDKCCQQFKNYRQKLLSMNDQNNLFDKLQIGIDALSSDVTTLIENQGVISQQLEETQQNFEEAKQYLMSKLKEPSRWRKIKNQKPAQSA